MKKLLLFLSFLSASFSFEIRSIEFLGLLHLSPEIAKEISGLKVGEEYDPALGDKAIKKLFKQGYFEDIWISEEGGNLRIHLKEKPTIAKIEYEGISEDDEKNIGTIIGVSKGMVYDKESMKQAKTRIVQYFEAKGYFDTIVEESFEPLEEISSIKLLFTINRGESVTIQKITLANSKSLDYDDIEPAIINKQREFLGWFWGFNDGKLMTAALPSDSGRIKDEYLTHGFLDANVSNAFLELNYDNYDAKILYDIEEGEQYKVGKISISQSENVIDEEDLLDDLILESDDVFNVKKLRRDLANMEIKVADLGYAYVRVYPQTTQDKEKKIVNINYVIYPGQKVYINKVIIGGNTKTADHVIRRDVFLGPGELYNRTQLKESRNSLKRTGYFEDANIQEKRVSADKLDLYVSVKEGSTGSITGGIGYGSTQGIIFDLGFSDKNILGSGMHGSIKANRSDDDIYGSINLTNPRIFDSLYSLGGSLYARDSQYSSYDEKVYGASLTLGRQFLTHFHGSLNYTLEQTKISNLSKGLREIGYRDGTNIKSAITPALGFDNTDDYYLPRSGFIARTSLEFAGIGGDEKFTKSISNFKIFYGLRDMIDYDLILRYKARFRAVKDNGYLPINERLYLGGITSLRGYDARSIGPKNSDGYEYGGKISFNNSVEASIPLINRINMRAAVFYDYGMIGIEKLDEYKRQSTGLAIEWLSPLGAINLIFARAIKPKPGDDTSNFEFSIGRQF